MGTSKRTIADIGTVDSRDLTSQVVDKLRQAILSGLIEPGARLIELDLAAQMGVSRAPIREAIRVLDQEGLVELFPYRGAVAVGMSNDEIAACYELRAVIEENAVRAVMATDAEGLIDRLAAIAQAMEGVADDDFDARNSLDVAFHLEIVAASGYRYLERKWQSLEGAMRLRNLQSVERPGKLADYWRSTYVSSHVEILDAIRSGDSEAARQAVRDHVLVVAPMMAEVDSEL